MALSSGTRHLLRETASWTVIADVGAVAFAHYDDLTTGIAGAVGKIRSVDPTTPA